MPGFSQTLGGAFARRPIRCLALTVSLTLIVGCASTPAPQSAASKVAPLPSGVVLHQDKDIQGAWLAAGFNFKGYDVLYIAETRFAAIERPNEIKMREMAMSVLRSQLKESLENTRLFPTVTTSTNDVAPGSRTLKLDNTIIEYEKGGGGARYWAGIFGAGQPVLRVRGILSDGDKPVCVYELKRSGESAGARLGGVWMSDEEIQRNDIRDLGNDLADFVERTAGVP